MMQGTFEDREQIKIEKLIFRLRIVEKRQFLAIMTYLCKATDELPLCLRMFFFEALVVQIT